eukprot:6211199-Pleurochrysis_carterae.AAC.5
MLRDSRFGASILEQNVEWAGRTLALDTDASDDDALCLFGSGATIRRTVNTGCKHAAHICRVLLVGAVLAVGATRGAPARTAPLHAHRAHGGAEAIGALRRHVHTLSEAGGCCCWR